MSPNVSRTVLVTGAGGGMSRGINARLAAAGHRLLLADLSLEAAETAAAAVTDAGGRAEAFQLDVADAASVHALAADVEQQVGDVDVVLNAAGILLTIYCDQHPLPV